MNEIRELYETLLLAAYDALDKILKIHKRALCENILDKNTNAQYNKLYTGWSVLIDFLSNRRGHMQIDEMAATWHGLAIKSNRFIKTVQRLLDEEEKK